MNRVYLRLEILRIFRSPQFAVFTIVVPLGMFLLFGSMFGDETGPDGVKTGVTTMINMAAYGSMSGALFTGTRVATDRTDGWQRQLRLTPMRGPGYLAVKIASAMAMALPVVLVVFAAGALRGAQLSAGQWLLTGLALWLGALPFAVLGLLLGLYGKGDTVGAMTGALMLPLGVFGGLWMPLAFLPQWMSTVAHFLPTYWLGRLAALPVGHGGGFALAAGVLAAWLVLPALVVVRRFRLDPGKVA
ncbi:ABC transporter permease [Amycolatopsis jiangsuensis]|uniref:ABC-2 type transport system permease protein n=1 Tax=Amycolatopsis jiangsuensis TaxID=1181879 RepID=A0A840IW75_9PSEU|nr:ABC transporter permease [Amycolatopsis jiangsuensis]MBB4685685.1 ABC-2 type transport system permease protein [Amycolatopsis jiangsuensis]